MAVRAKRTEGRNQGRDIDHCPFRRPCEPRSVIRPLLDGRFTTIPGAASNEPHAMPILTHLTPEKDARSIRRSGIRATVTGHTMPSGVFCMPVLPDYFASHQWLRELKRRGQRTMVAVDFRLRSDEPAWFGLYGRPHTEMTVGRAVGMLMEARDRRGFEVIIPRPIGSDEILRIRTPRQVAGWRYKPDAHGVPPCPCRVCLPRGTIKSARARRRLDPTGERY